MTCSHSLLDLPSAKERLITIDNLWRRTSGFLILIEDGTNAGYQVRLMTLRPVEVYKSKLLIVVFQVLSEARDYLLRIAQHEVDFQTKDPQTEGHLFAPVSTELVDLVWSLKLSSRFSSVPRMANAHVSTSTLFPATST